MINARNHAWSRSQTESHVDITNLRHRRISNHPVDIIFPDGINGAHNHSRDAEHKQHVDNLAFPDNVKADDPVKDFDQQKDISLRDQRRQNRRGGQCRISVGVRQPCMERIKRALNGDSHRHQTDGDEQRNMIFSRRLQKRSLLFDIAHQKMPRQAV